MDALIQQYEEEKYHFSGFWKKLSSSTGMGELNVLFTGPLKLKSKSATLKTRQFKLTSEFLYLCSDRTRQPKKLAAVRWKRVDPFTEENGAEVRFGFRLARGPCFQDFYAEGAEALEKWLDELAKVGIMSDLENDFDVGDEIGRGNYARVFLGRSMQDQSSVAIKTITKEGITKSSRNVTALINEVNLMKSLSHPRIVKLLAMYESETELHLVLEYVGGGDLFQRLIKKGKYSEAKATIFMKHLLEAIDYMHNHSVVHRDLKPENVLLVSGTDGVEFKIADFGLASEYHSGESLTLRCGSPGYVAPEILEKHGYDTKVDVFSAGIIMYILLSGRSPFSSEDINEILIRNRNCKIYFQQKYWQGISQEGINLVISLTEKTPSRRPTAHDALAHPWFALGLTHVSPVSPHDPQDAIPVFSPNEHLISSEMMKRMNNGAQIEHPSFAPFNKQIPVSTEKPIDWNEELSPKRSKPHTVLKSLRNEDQLLKNITEKEEQKADGIQGQIEQLKMSEETAPGKLMALHKRH